MRRLLLGTVGVIMVAPFLYMISVSFMGEGELLRWPPPLLPASPTTGNYAAAIEALPYTRVLLNTAILAGCVMIGQVLTSAAAGYAFARMRFPGRDGIWKMLLAMLAIPAILLALICFLANLIYPWQQYRQNIPLNLPGGKCLRLGEDQVASYRWLYHNLRAETDTFLTLPGLYSLHFWTGLPAATADNITAWTTVLSAVELPGPGPNRIEARLNVWPVAL